MIIYEGVFPWLRHISLLQSHNNLIETPMFDEGYYTQFHPIMAAVTHD